MHLIKKVKKSELNQIIVSMKPTQFKYLEDNDIADAVAKKSRIKFCDSLQLIVKTQIKSLKLTNSSK